MTTNPDAPPTTVLPYGPGNRWTFTAKDGGHTQTQELALTYLPGGTEFTDDYLPDEVTSEALWRMWTTKIAGLYHEKHPDQFHPGEVPIYWTVIHAHKNGIYETAPHIPDHPQNFLTYYTHPVHAVTGERLNWLRLPVEDRWWNATDAHRGGFVQQATGWKPSALQPTMNFRQLDAAAGLNALSS